MDQMTRDAKRNDFPSPQNLHLVKPIRITVLNQKTMGKPFIIWVHLLKIG